MSHRSICIALLRKSRSSVENRCFQGEHKHRDEILYEETDQPSTSTGIREVGNVDAVMTDAPSGPKRRKPKITVGFV